MSTCLKDSVGSVKPSFEPKICLCELTSCTCVDLLLSVDLVGSVKPSFGAACAVLVMPPCPGKGSDDAAEESVV